MNTPSIKTVAMQVNPANLVNSLRFNRAVL